MIMIAVVTRSAMAAGIGVILVGMAYGYSPRGYTLSSRRLVVHRLIGDVDVPLEGFLDARSAVAGDLRGAIRLWGNGGRSCRNHARADYCSQSR